MDMCALTHLDLDDGRPNIWTCVAWLNVFEATRLTTSHASLLYQRPTTCFQGTRPVISVNEETQMRHPLRDPPTDSNIWSSRVVLIASAALVLSGAMQLATTWLQTRSAATCSCACTSTGLPESPTFEQDYTWKDTDYPPYLPLPLGPPVVLTVENTRHYALSPSSPNADTDANTHTDANADAEWHAVYPGEHFGFLHLGPEKRFFGLAMYHQMHCLNVLRQAVSVSASPAAANTSSPASMTAPTSTSQPDPDPHTYIQHKRTPLHLTHCLNYLRQSVLCAADLTLEPELWPGAGNVGQGLGVAHVCRDWSAVHAYAAANWEAWRVWEGEREGMGQNASASAGVRTDDV
ncbi:hypothetical protein EIP86_009370 [Pleurotus ostreatoroseus]|nr:hypothetical protein EIP86_009370 [Pleurotus ostreatoroseus]